MLCYPLATNRLIIPSVKTVRILDANALQSGFALGQICLILLVDLMVSPVQLGDDHIPLLLQVVLVLWDHYTPVVQDQAQEMLVHLIHELVISKIEDDTVGIDKRSIEDFIDNVRRHDPKVVWNYDDKNGKDSEDSGAKVPEAMTYVATEVLRIMEYACPGLRASRLVKILDILASSLQQTTLPCIIITTPPSLLPLSL